MLLWRFLGFRRLLVVFILRRLWRMYRGRLAASRPSP
jgi:hypothetical protein